jgi:MerR family mercuric resistance operon transcriptional regulator
VETVRYYQQRKLLPVPASQGSFRRYDEHLVQRIRFIKRAQELGFALEEIRELLRLNDGTDRRAIRRISTARLDQIENKVKDLNRMRAALKHLIAECERAGKNHPCPIIETLSGDS